MVWLYMKMKKYENFCRAYANLCEASETQPPYSTLELTGLVALFEIAFEQAWKMMKEVLEFHGYSESATDSPRFIIQTAFSASMIDDADVWIMALQSRNNASYAYNKVIAEEIVRLTKEKYISMFGKLKDAVETRWLPQSGT